jgi:hypothetical protein
MSAPQVTGHPFGLPAPKEPVADVQKVQPILDARHPETQLGNQNPPSEFWRLVQGEPDPLTHEGPPSIMQIKISQMLNDQATEMAIAEARKTGPETPVAASSVDDPEAALPIFPERPETPEHLQPKPIPEPDVAVILPFKNREPAELALQSGRKTAAPEPPAEPVLAETDPRPAPQFGSYGDTSSQSRGKTVSTLS